MLQTKADLQATSSQDQFAKWAKLRRKLDKEVADLEALSMSLCRSVKLSAETGLDGSITSQKAGAQTMVTAALFVLTTAAPFVYTSVHSKSAVFYPPRGWFGPFERFLSLPFGPAGQSALTARYGAQFFCRSRLLRDLDDGMQENAQIDRKSGS